MRFKDKVVIVTGASRGIGREIALAFGREGAAVACLATTQAGAEKTSKELSAIHNPQSTIHRGYACDVSDSAAVESTFEQILEDLGTPAVLVNNAGITRDNLMMRLKEEDWDRVIDVNLKGAFLCTQAVTRAMMKARYGRIINLSSVVGLHGQSGQTNYAASKAGLIGLTLAVAKELGSRGITCNAVAPGFIESEMTDALPPEFKEKVQKEAPAGRLGTAADIAPAILFLASEEAGYITGQTLTIDGGLFL